jgi:hypothetical protein
LNVLLLRVMCVTCLLCTCCTTATGLKPICSKIINIYNIYITHPGVQGSLSAVPESSITAFTQAYHYKQVLRSSIQIPRPYFCKILFNIILSFMLTSSKCIFLSAVFQLKFYMRFFFPIFVIHITFILFN